MKRRNRKTLDEMLREYLPALVSADKVYRLGKRYDSTNSTMRMMMMIPFSSHNGRQLGISRNCSCFDLLVNGWREGKLRYIRSQMYMGPSFS
jgi:hypothetical protein